MLLKRFITPAVAALMIFSVGCSQQDVIETSDANGNNQTISLIKSNESSLRVSLADINTAINTLQSKSNTTKSRSALPTYEVSEYQNAGVTEFYVVNFEDNNGFILLSATKALNPILAYSNSGNFPIYTEKPEGLENWISNVASITQKRNKLPEDSLKETIYQWNLLLHTAEINTNKKSAYTVNGSNDNVYALGKRLIKEAIDEAIDRGAVAIYYPYEDFCNNDNISAGVWDIGMDLVYADFQETWQDYVFVAKCLTSKRETITETDPTTWGQQNGYNRFYDTDENGNLQKAGCGPVAIAQYMHHFKHPENYEWAKMSPNQSDDYNARLIHDIAVKCNTKNGSTSYQDLLNAFEVGVYNVKVYYGQDLLGDHLTQRMREYEQAILVGQDKGGAGGHAWIVSGMNNVNFYYTYYIYYVQDPYTQADYKKVATDATHETRYYFYMNWGWYGKYDGYYSDPDIRGSYSFDVDWVIVAKPVK